MTQYGSMAPRLGTTELEKTLDQSAVSCMYQLIRTFSFFHFHSAGTGFTSSVRAPPCFLPWSFDQSAVIDRWGLLSCNGSDQSVLVWGGPGGSEFIRIMKLKSPVNMKSSSWTFTLAILKILFDLFYYLYFFIIPEEEKTFKFKSLFLCEPRKQ